MILLYDYANVCTRFADHMDEMAQPEILSESVRTC